MHKYRILQNNDHCLMQKRYYWFFWKYYTASMFNEKEFTWFRSGARMFSCIDDAEAAIMRSKVRSSELKKINAKYTVIKPKVESKLYNMLNSDDEW